MSEVAPTWNSGQGVATTSRQEGLARDRVLGFAARTSVANPSRAAFRIHTADIRRWLSTRVAAAHESSLSGGQERDAYAAVGDPRRRATFVMLGGTSFITRWVTPWAGVAR
jgi:hypothetical protein